MTAKLLGRGGEGQISPVHPLPQAFDGAHGGQSLSDRQEKSTATAEGPIYVQRFRRLVEWLGDQHGNARGWKTIVARKLDVSPSHLTKIMNGERQVTWDRCTYAAEVLDLDIRYFLDSLDETPDPSNYTKGRGGFAWSDGVDQHSLLAAYDLALTFISLSMGPGATSQDEIDRTGRRLLKAVLNLRIVRLAQVDPRNAEITAAPLALQLRREVEELRTVRPDKYTP